MLFSCEGKNIHDKNTRGIIEFQTIEYSYADSLDSYFLHYKTDSVLDRATIAMLIPKTNEEYIIFYNLTVKTDQQPYFQYLYNSLINNVGSDSSLGMPFLGLSNLVDGEIAESYFIDAYWIFKDDKLILCTSYNKEDFPRLESLYEHFCKGKELKNKDFYE